MTKLQTKLQIKPSMKLRRISLPLLSLCASLGLLPMAPGLSEMIETDLTNQSSFIDWLLGRRDRSADRRPPGAGDPPAGSRGDICLISPALGPQERVISQTNPVFILDGPIGGLAVVEDGGETPLWTVPASQDLTTARYDGDPLQPGEWYQLNVYNALFTNSVIYSIDFQVMTLTDQASVIQDLEAIALEVTANNQTEEDLLQQRANYFWAQGLKMDAWRETVELAIVSDEVAQMLQSIPDRLCQN